MKLKKVLLCILMLVVITFNFYNCYAKDDTTIYRASLLSDIFSQGNQFYNKAASSSSDSSIGNDIANYLKESGGIIDLIKSMGYLVFSVVTVCLGAKYIWSGVEGKTAIKETLPTFVIAVVLFYLADNLYTLFSGTATSIFTGSASFDTVAGSIRATINVIIRVAAMAGIVFLGVKYMFASSSGRADIKNTMVPVIIGMILVYSASQVVEFIANVGNQVI